MLVLVLHVVTQQSVGQHPGHGQALPSQTEVLLLALPLLLLQGPLSLHVYRPPQYNRLHGKMV